MSAVAATDLPATDLGADRIERLAQGLRGLTPAQLYWVAAWAASLAAAPAPSAVADASRGADASRLTVLYGSQTGNARRIAEQLAERSRAAGLPVRLLRADAYPARELARETHLLVVISTQGEGEPPDDARALVEFIDGKRAPTLAGLKFAVLGLGDSSYPQFCVIGRRLDARLAELGGQRMTAFGEADVDIEAVSTPWSEATLAQAKAQWQTEPVRPAGGLLHVVPDAARHSRERPFAAAVLANQRIVGRDSARDVRHIELSLAGSGLSYQPGDAVGVVPRNPPTLVEQWLQALRLPGDTPVTRAGRTQALAAWLQDACELTRPSRPLVAALAARSGDGELTRILQPEQSGAFATLLAHHQTIDLLRRYPAPWEPDALLAALRPLTPRLYSIASSPALVGDEVHLTVAVVEYEAFGSTHWGAASSGLAAAADDATIPIFIETNDRFRLPADDDRDIIMIGPGTGVAPFRAFVQERQARGARGRNWLFFGNRHFGSEFLYQVEWQQALRDGALHRLDLAFSRDQAQRIHVQQRLREHGAELYAWLREGAHLYVCGDATHMARDVHAALLDVIITHGSQSSAAAKAWLDELLQQGRYARDVY